MAEPENLPAPRVDDVEGVKDVERPKQTKQMKTRGARRKLPGFVKIVLLCVASSALTTWLLVASGVVKPDIADTITENREKLVLQEGEIVADVFKAVSPSTVAITTEATAQDEFFGSSVQEGAGSGIIISADGYVLTNKHVVPDGVTRVTVVLHDGREFSNVEVIGRDPFNDVAFLKIGGATDLPAAKLGDSAAVEPGQKVVAIGNALGEFRNSVTTGIISGLGRPIEASDGAGSSETLENLFQTDAAINPGNSGGPLVNLKGEVIGINTAIAEEAEGIGFAIPINDAKGLIKTVLEQGEVIKPYLGVRYLSITREVADEFGLPVRAGAYVRGDARNAAVIVGSPADKAGLKEGDIITKVNDLAVTESASLASLLGAFAPGDKVGLTYLRDGQEKTVEVTLEVYPGQ